MVDKVQTSKVHKEWWLLTPWENIPNFSGEETESADNHFDVFNDYLEIEQINVDANVAQIINRFCNSLFGKAKQSFNHSREGGPHGTVADWNVLKEQLKEQLTQ